MRIKLGLPPATLLLCGLLLSCGGSPDGSRETASKPAAVGRTQSITLSYSDLDGSNEREGRLAITLEKFQAKARLPRRDLRGVDEKPAHHWVRARIRVQGLGPDAISQGLVRYQLVDSSGQRYSFEDSPSMYEPASDDEGNELSQGDLWSGYVAFQVKNGAKVRKLRATSGVSDEPPVEWVIR